MEAIWFWGEKCLYKMSKDNIATKLDWNDLLANAEFVLSSSYYDGENGAKVIRELVDTSNYLSVPIIDLFFNDNDELIMHLGNSGYLVIPNPINSIANTIDESGYYRISQSCRRVFAIIN